jgi:protein-tyrosine-phosphatase/diadenosine tetraphosphate (Ap4A) HIT family hydrolase
MRNKSILFVCTGNVFRSLSAEYSFKQYLSQNNLKGWRVSSAGIIAKPEPIDPETLAVLRGLGIKNIRHHQKKLTKGLLDRHDIIVALAENHVNFIKRKFGRQALLFNELAVGRRTSIWDIEDEVPDWQTNRPAEDRKIDATVNNIHAKIPRLFKKADERFYLFSDFVSGRKLHRNGYPFIKLAESPLALAFMSIDIPYNEDGNIIVIPKKRYVDFSEIPATALQDMTGLIQKIGRSVSRNHGGYNVLLNNGADAGQFIFHSHFHIIPRNYYDGVRIEVWKHQNIKIKDFIKLNNNLKKQINS